MPIRKAARPTYENTPLAHHQVKVTADAFHTNDPPVERPARFRPKKPLGPQKKTKLKPSDVWAPEDSKPGKPHATVTHFTEPLLKNLCDPETQGDKERAALQLAMMRASCAYFASEVLTGPPQAPYDGRFIAAEHHEEWDKLVTNEKRVCVLAPRDHGKTFFFDFAYPIWKAAHQPDGKGYIFSATKDQAIRILGDIAEEIESNPKLQWLVPKVRSGKRSWSRSAITLSNGHKIYARGYGTKVRGAHPDWIVCDDVLNDEDRYSEVKRTKNIDYFYTAITNMIVPGGTIIVVGTPFSGRDLYADLARNSRYCFRKFPALRQDGSTLWPARYSKQTLEDKRIEIGSVRFTCEFLCEPISDDMSLFPERLFRGTDVELMNVRLGMPAKFWDDMGITRRYVGVDFAISSSTAADFTAVFVIGVNDEGTRYIIDIQQHKGLAYQEQLSLINALGRKYRPDVIYLEANQMQRIFGDELILKSDLPIMKFFTTGAGRSAKANRKKVPSGNTVSQNKNSLEGGVPALRVLLENKKFRIPRGDAHSVEMTDRWINEMKHFTWVEGKLQGVGAHDDLVMACWITDRAVRDTAFSFSGDTNIERNVTLDEIIKEQIGMDERQETEALKKEDAWLEHHDPVLQAIGRFAVNPNVKRAPVKQTGIEIPETSDTRPPADMGLEDEDERRENDAAVRAARSAWSHIPGLSR